MRFSPRTYWEAVNEGRSMSIGPSKIREIGYGMPNRQTKTTLLVTGLKRGEALPPVQQDGGREGVALKRSFLPRLVEGVPHKDAVAVPHQYQ